MFIQIILRFIFSASDFATFNSASRLVVGEAFYPPAFKDSIWNTPLAFIQAQSLSPAHCGRIVTPVEVEIWKGLLFILILCLL